MSGADEEGSDSGSASDRKLRVTAAHQQGEEQQRAQGPAPRMLSSRRADVAKNRDVKVARERNPGSLRALRALQEY